jgi:hypothetical protein
MHLRAVRSNSRFVIAQVNIRLEAEHTLPGNFARFNPRISSSDFPENMGRW